MKEAIAGARAGSASSIRSIAERLRSLATSAIAVMLKFLLGIVGLGGVLTGAKKVIDAVYNKVKSLVTRVASAIWNKLKSFLGRLAGAIGNWLFPPATSGNVTVSVKENGTVMVARSPAVPYNPNNEPHECNPLKTKLDTAIRVYKDKPTESNKDKAVKAEQKLADCLNENGAVGGDYCAAMNYSYASTVSECGGGDKSWIARARKASKTKIDPPRKGNQKFHGHHIVMKGQSKPDNKEAQQILCKHNINPFCGKENLAITRNKCHSNAYAARVLAELTYADEEYGTKDKIIEALYGLAVWHANCRSGQRVDPKTDE